MKSRSSKESSFHYFGSTLKAMRMTSLGSTANSKDIVPSSEVVGKETASISNLPFRAGPLVELARNADVGCVSVAYIRWVFPLTDWIVTFVVESPIVFSKEQL